MATEKQLREEYENALEAYRDDSSFENYERYMDAQDAFADTRKARKVDEDVDPNHPRGQAFAMVRYDDGRDPGSEVVPDDARELTEGDEQ